MHHGRAAHANTTHQGFSWLAMGAHGFAIVAVGSVSYLLSVIRPTARKKLESVPHAAAAVPYRLGPVESVRVSADAGAGRVRNRLQAQHEAQDAEPHRSPQPPEGGSVILATTSATQHSAANTPHDTREIRPQSRHRRPSQPF